jgi:polyhydroxyalkanoate synthesis regulator phasin
MELLEKSKLFFLGLWSLTEEKVTEFAEDMVKRGKITGEEAKKMVKDFAEKSKDKMENLQDQASGKFAKSIKDLGFVTKEEHDDLKKKLSELEKKIASAKPVAKPRTAAKPKSKS